ncbi:tryptophan transporter [Peribacillus cavernae]|uniref:Tryptophan transporter n=1 Tax=Peribacillus cavernae TaxID=1674310 RepID=A0A3S0UEX7_9BACI|nr:tryptophan transporter [Peribacillus cavernae]MDQ0217606.1 ABC-type multidrug transport system fused ATPase/permease subunit [Peribacillus cavernae]RUQ29964.1 tryptophan transporter [Peribacillus cavernae]
MNTKVLVSLSLLVGIGAALHLAIPGFILGMKPDMMLTMAFLAIILFPEKKNVFLVAIASGIISGLTSSFPGGFIPNIIDKFVTAFVFYFLVMAFKKHAGSIVTAGILTAVGTLISGVVFLTSAYFIVGLPGAFVGMFAGAVLPATVLNTVAVIILYPIVTRIMKKSNTAAHV